MHLQIKKGGDVGGGGQLEKCRQQLWEEVDDTRGSDHAGSLDHAGGRDAQLSRLSRHDLFRGAKQNNHNVEHKFFSKGSSRLYPSSTSTRDQRVTFRMDAPVRRPTNRYDYGLVLCNFYRPRSEASEGYVFTGICLSNSEKL